MKRGHLVAQAFLAALWAGWLTAAPAAPASEAALRVQVDGVAPLPPRAPGTPKPSPPTAAELRALRKRAIANGVESAVLVHASELARDDVREDEAALREALGALEGYALGHSVLRELGAREAIPKPRPGEPPPRPRRPSDPIPMEHAWRVEVLVDAARVRAALEQAGLAFSGALDPTSAVDVVLEAPYDAAGLAALRGRIQDLGAISVVPRRFRADAVVLAVRGLGAELVRERLQLQPPDGYEVETTLAQPPQEAVHVRLSRAVARRAR